MSMKEKKYGPWLRLNLNCVEYRKGRTWKVMDWDDAWSILSILRGPDDGEDWAKRFWTGRFRGLFVKWVRSGTGELEWEPVDIEESGFLSKCCQDIYPPVGSMEAQNSTLESLATHYRCHADEAIATLKRLFGYWPLNGVKP
jgi:hypothetical protein